MFNSDKIPLYEISFDRQFIIEQGDNKNDLTNKKFETVATNGDTAHDTLVEELRISSQSGAQNIEDNNHHFQSNTTKGYEHDQEINSEDEYLEFEVNVSQKSSRSKQFDEFNSSLTVKYFQYQKISGYGLKNDSKDIFSSDVKKKNEPFNFTMRSSNLLNKSMTILTSNLYETKIDVKSLTYTEEQFECFKVTYFKANYNHQDRSVNFSAAIIPKNTAKARDYLFEVFRQNNLNLDMFIKPILYYFDQKFQYVLYPYLKKKVIQQEKSNKSVLRNIKDIVSFQTIQHSNKLAFRSQTTENLFIYNGKIKFLRSANMIHTENQTNKMIRRYPIYTIMNPIEFTPPEIFDKGWCNEKADIWALGCIIFKLCNNIMPYNSNNYDFNIHIKSYYMAKFNLHIPIELQIVIRAMLEFDPSNRPSIFEIVLFPWFKDQMNEEKAKQLRIERLANEKKESETTQKTMQESKSGWGFSLSSFRNIGQNIKSSVCGSKYVDFEKMGRSLSRSLSQTKDFLERSVSRASIKVFKKVALCNFENSEDDIKQKYTPIEQKREQLIEKLKLAEKVKAKERRDLINNIVPSKKLKSRKERKLDSDKKIMIEPLSPEKPTEKMFDSFNHERPGDENKNLNKKNSKKSSDIITASFDNCN